MDITNIINNINQVKQANKADKVNNDINSKNFYKILEIDILNTLFEKNVALNIGLPNKYFIMYSYPNGKNENILMGIILITQFYISSNKKRQRR